MTRPKHHVPPPDRLDAGFADVIRTAVISEFSLFLQPFHVVVVNPADVADYMRCQLSKGIMPEQACLDFNTREAVVIHGETRHLDVV